MINSIRLKSLGAVVVLVLGIAAPPAEAQTQSVDEVRQSVARVRESIARVRETADRVREGVAGVTRNQVRDTADRVRKSADQVRKSADQVRKSVNQARRDNDMWIGPRCGFSPSIWNSIEVGDPEKAGVRVWWQASRSQDEALAKKIADASKNAIIPAVLELLGRFPTDSGGVCGGRSKALDVALVAHTGESPAKTTGDDGNCGTSSYTEVNRAHVNLRTVAHEIFHAATNTYKVAAKCSSYDWLAEATAVWFEDYVTSEQYGFNLEPKFEHGYATDLLKNPQVSLEKVEAPPGSYGSGIGYGSYLLPYFVSQCPVAIWQSDASITQCDSKDPLVVRRIWEGTQRLGALDAVDAALPGGFGSVWKDFVIANWNREPLAPPPPYAQWSPKLNPAVYYAASERIDLTLNGEESARRALPAAVDHLASRYYQLKFTDDRVRYFQFQNPFSAGKDPAAAVQAIYSLKDGTRKLEDWTARPDVTFCRDRAAEDVTEIVLVFSNSSINVDHVLSPGSDPAYEAKNSCGPVQQEAKGTLTWDYSLDHTGEDGSTYRERGKATFDLRFTRTSSFQVIWEVDPSSSYVYDFTARAENSGETRYIEKHGAKSVGEDDHMLDPKLARTSFSESKYLLYHLFGDFEGFQEITVFLNPPKTERRDFKGSFGISCPDGLAGTGVIGKVVGEVDGKVQVDFACDHSRSPGHNVTTSGLFEMSPIESVSEPSDPPGHS